MEMYAGVWIKGTCTVSQLAAIHSKASSLCSYTEPMTINTDLQQRKHMLSYSKPYLNRDAK